MASGNYTAKDITVLEGLEPVRKRPGMYIGGVGSAGLHHLVWEILDNAVDEAMNGYASNIWVTLHSDGSSITIEDDGRGIPIDKHPTTKKSALEVIFTVLHAGGKFEHGSYKTAGGLHGVGASVVNALSKELVATVKRDGAQWEMRFRQGKPTGPLKKLGAARGTGTAVYFHPDAGIVKAVRNFIETHHLSPKGVTLTAEDIREGLTGVLSAFIAEPQFQGQTKDRLNNPEMVSAVDGIVRPALEHWLNHNNSVAESIVARIILSARAREASRAAQAEVSRKSATSTRLNLPGKLSDCTNGSSEGSELFVVEGDSARGSAKQGRDGTRQAILPMSGKVMNPESAPLRK